MKKLVITLTCMLICFSLFSGTTATIHHGKKYRIIFSL